MSLHDREGAKQEEKNVKTEKVVNSEKGGGNGRPPGSQGKQA